VLVQSIDDGYNLPSPVVGAPVTTTITLTFNANGNVGFGALLNSLALQGTNAADFAIVGGTCSPSGATTLSAGNTSCTVVVRYTPPVTATETAQLAVRCTTIGLIGGFSLSCGSGSATTGLISLFGSALANAAIPAPVRDPKTLTLFALALLGIGTYFAARRNG
jgi:hypothetical protein